MQYLYFSVSYIIVFGNGRPISIQAFFTQANWGRSLIFIIKTIPVPNYRGKKGLVILIGSGFDRSDIVGIS